MKKLVRILAVIVALSAQKPRLGADASGASEYEVQSRHALQSHQICRLASSSLPASDSSLVLAILGLDNFGDDFKRMVEGKTINGRKLVMKRVTWGETLSTSICFS